MLKNTLRSIPLAAVVMVMGLTSTAAATDYYVATTGKDSNPGTALSLPFQTIQKAVKVVKAGDTVYVKGGRYAPFTILNKLGTEAKRIVFKPYNREAVTIDRDLGGDGAISGLVIYDSNYITVEGMEITDSRVARLNVLGRNACNEADLQIIKQTRATGITMNSSSNGPLNYITIKDMNIHHNAREGISSHGGKAPGRGVGNQYLNNRIHHNGGYAVYISGEKLLFRGNQIYNNNAYGAHMYSVSTHLQNPIVEKNLFINNGLAECYYFLSGDSVKVASANTGLLIKSKDGIIRNNVIVGNYGDGINIHCYDQSGCHNHILNNNIVANRKAGLSESNSQGPNIMQNNIIYGNKTEFSGLKANTVTSHNLTVDPKFVNAGTQDYRLRSDSPAIDVGLKVPQVTDDFLGILRPQGSGFDIGAYEYQSGTSDEPQLRPVAPTGLELITMP